jgi:tRNA A37 N6-isopentenylltransferase MiaA
MTELPRIIAIVGATGSGKTQAAIRVAEAHHGELVSIDSLQVYRGMDIGTNKERNLPVTQHMIDLLDPGDAVDVGWFQHQAYACIDKLLFQEKLPVLVGGTMMYMNAIIEGYTFPGAVRKYDAGIFGISVDRQVLRQRQYGRVDAWLAAGFLEEINSLLDAGVAADWLDACGLEYRFFLRHIQGKLSLSEAREQTVLALGQYIKRQETWWRHHGPVTWCTSEDQLLQEATQFLARPPRS